MLLKDLPVGSYVKDYNTCLGGKPIIWQVIDQNHKGYPDNSTLLFAKEILMVGPFDNCEPKYVDDNNTGMYNFKTKGNNKWSVSNVRTWLNSSDTSWFKMKHQYDYPPIGNNNNFNYYAQPGFLSNFSSEFLDKILTTAIITKEYQDSTGEMAKVQTSQKIFLPSALETGLGGAEGTQIDFLSGSSKQVNRKRPISAYAKSLYNLSNKIYDNQYMTRSNDNSYSGIKIATSSLSVGTAMPKVDNGICPMMNVDNTVSVTLDSSDNVYALDLGGEKPSIDLSKYEIKFTDKITGKDLTGDFESKAQPTWTSYDDVTETITLKKDNSDISSFKKDNTLTDTGSYTLTVTITDPNHADNKKTFTTTFNIKISDYTFPDKIDFKDKLTNKELTGTFKLEAQPTWNRITDSNISETILLKKNTTISNNFKYEEKLTDEGEYTLTVTYTQKNKTSNSKEYSTSFTIINDKMTFPQDLNFKDKLTNKDLTGKFENKVQPTWDAFTTYLETYELKKDNNTVNNFTKEKILEENGSYTLSVTLTDPNYSDNKKTYVKNFTIEVPEKQDLSNINIKFTDKITGKDLTGDFFSKVVPTWERITDSNLLESFILEKDGNQVNNYSYEKQLTDLGSYKITVTVTDKNFQNNSKEFSAEFRIKESDLDLSTYSIKATDKISSKSLSGKFAKKAQPTWEIQPDKPKVKEEYTLSKDGTIVNGFNKEDILSELGEYRLTITIKDPNNENNSRNFTFKFTISDDDITVDKVDITFTDEISKRKLLGYFEKTVQPSWTYNCDVSSFTESFSLTKDGKPLTYSKGDLLSDFGSYVLSVTLTDPKVSNSSKTFNAPFIIRAEQIDFSTIDINIKDKITSRTLTGIFEEKAQPTWVKLDTVLDITETISLKKDNIVKPFNYEDILTEKGEYVLIVTLTNNKDTTNYKDYEKEFSIVGKQIIFPDITFKDKLTAKPLSGEFEGKAQPTWNREDYINDSSVLENYIIMDSNNNPLVGFNFEDIITDVGKYTLTLVLANKLDSTNTKSYSTEFEIKPNQLDLTKFNINFIESLSTRFITEGSVFQDQAKIYWDDIDNVQIEVSLDWNLTDGTYGMEGSVKKGLKTYKGIGDYTIHYILRDVNYPTNVLDGTINFKIEKEKENLDNIDISIIDNLTNREITNGSQFADKAQPFITLKAAPENISFELSLSYEGNYMPFSNKDTLTTIGKYTLTVTVRDLFNSDNFKTEIRDFEIVNLVTDLDNFDLQFVNRLTGNGISEGQVFILPSNKVQPYWTFLPPDITITTYELFRNGVKTTYDCDVDKLDFWGDYTFQVTVKNHDNNTKTFTRNFQLKDSDLDLMSLNIKIMNVLDNLEITDQKKYEEENVKPIWDEPSGTTINFSLTFNGNPYIIYNGNTLLTEIGEYVLTLDVEETGNPSNNLQIVRTFYIVYKPQDFDPDNLHLTDDLTSLDINDGQVFKEKVLPDFYYADPEGTIKYDLFYSLYRDGVEIKTFEPGKAIYTTPGLYHYTITLTDPNYPNNQITKTVEFSILAQPIDLTDREIVITNKLTSKIINYGEVFEDINPEVQPTWQEYSDLKYTYTLALNNNPLSAYKKEDILRDLGEYNLYVRATDPNYPSNYIEKTVAFVLKSNSGTSEPEYGEEAYLNGLPFTLGTPVTSAGRYDLIVVRRNPNNFKFSMTEVNFDIVEDNLAVKPIITNNPDYVPCMKTEVTIYYPSYATEKEYKININGNWTTYNGPFEVTKNCTIYARCKDSLSDFFAEATKIIDNIDDTPPNPPEVLGFEKGRDTYFTVTPTVKPEFGCTYSAILNGENYELGTPIYNDGEMIKDYTLVVTATKITNGLSASTVVKFTLDSVPPDPPVIIGFNSPKKTKKVRALSGSTNVSTGVTYKETNKVQDLDSYLYTEATPDVIRVDGCDYESYLNGNNFILGTLIEKNGSYRLSATAIKKSNSLRATTVVVFAILNPIPDSIGVQRLALIPLREEYKSSAYDGELLVDTVGGHLSIFDDGALLSKTRELEEQIKQSVIQLKKIEINITRNESKILGLQGYVTTIKDNVDKLSRFIIECETDLRNIDRHINDYSFDTSDLDNLRIRAQEISNTTDDLTIDIEKLKSEIEHEPEEMKKFIKGLISNGSIIAESIWWKENKGYI